LLLRKTRFILSHHGRIIPGDNTLKSTIKRRVLYSSYKRIDSVTYLRRSIKNWIGSRNNPPRLEFLPVGADFDIFQLLNRSECKKKLGLPADKIFAVYVGAFYRLKGVDQILADYEQYRSENFEVLFVGGTSTDELHEQVVKSGRRYWGYINQRDLAVILSAADF
jgi:glycosyltransferase involved in cell wall biosynthesis